MNYLNIYKQLIQKRLNQPATTQYVQKHHIVPRSIDPSKTYDKNNIVVLSAREHYIAHALLVKITNNSKDKSKYYKMLCAYMSMTVPNDKNFEYRNILTKYKTNSKLYEYFRTQRSKYMIQSGCEKGANHVFYDTIVINNPITKQMRHIKKDQQIPEGWFKGKLKQYIKTGKQSITYGTKWIYNQKTLEQKLLKKGQQLEQGWVYGVSPTSKVRTTNHLNPSKGKMWISNLELKESKLIEKDEELEQGWLYGRIQDFDLYLQKYNDALTQKKRYLFINYQKSIKEHKVVKFIDKKFYKNN